MTTYPRNHGQEMINSASANKNLKIRIAAKKNRPSRKPRNGRFQGRQG